MRTRLNNLTFGAFVSVALMTGAGSAFGAASATITADNHYSLYTGSPASGITLLGGNELGAGGNPGTYNWSMAENFIFEPGDFIYIATWSDDAVAQGLLADITLPSGEVILSGDSRWEYIATNIDLDDGAPWPAASEISAYVAAADLAGTWSAPDIGGTNGVSPWGNIAGVSGSSKWMLGNPDRATDPFHGGMDHEEYQIFRMPVPTPGTASLAGLAGLVFLRRRKA